MSVTKQDPNAGNSRVADCFEAKILVSSCVVMLVSDSNA